MRSLLLLVAATLAMTRAVDGQSLGRSGPMPLLAPKAAAASVRDIQTRVYLAAEKQAHYLLGTVRSWQGDPALRLLTESRSGEHWIRPNTGALEGFAFLCRFGPYDSEMVGVPRLALLSDTVVPMMRYLVATHATGSVSTGDGKPWGDAWQSAHWAQMLGRAAWFVWAELPADLQEGARRVVAHEADRIAGTEPPHRLRSDTKAEENAWNSQILSVAVLLMPDDLRRPGWERGFQKWVMSSFLRPADEGNEEVVDGRPVREQFTGANIFDDFTLENHDFVHPDYMTTFSLSVGCAPDFALTGRRPPDALWHNVRPIYDNLKWMLLPDGGFVYPNGQDWELFRNPSWLVKHVLMATWLGDPDAWDSARLTLGTLERMQRRSAEGAVFHPAEYFFASTQTDLIRSLANAWLSLTFATEPGRPSPPPLGARRWDSAKVILRRTPNAIHTVSWGARIMAQCVPYRLDRIVSPDVRNGIGQIRLAGSPKPLPLRAREAQVTETEDEFEARLTVDHGEAVRAELTFRSRRDGSFAMEERLVALTNLTTAEIATGLVGVLNDPHWIHEQGVRRLAVDGRETEFPSGRAGERSWRGATNIVVDDVLRITSERPLPVSYLPAAKAERGRVTDRLVLNHGRAERSWRAGEVISDYAVLIRCEVAPK